MIKRIALIAFLILISIKGFSQEKTITSVKIQGNEKLKTSFIERILVVKSGSVLDSIKLEEDILRLKRIPAVSHATYQVFHSHDSEYNVFYNIEENYTIIPSVSIWTTTDKRVAYKLGIYDFNFLGRNISLGGSYQNNGFNSYAINFRAPYLFSNKFGLAVNLQDWKSKEPLYFEGGSANYKYNNKAFEVLGLYEINFKNSIQLGFNFFNEKYNILPGDFLPPVAQRNLDINKTLFKFIYNYDNLDYFFQYIDGFKSQFYGQYVATSNTFQDSFLIAWNDFFFYKRVGEKGNWANRLRMGLASNEESPFAPFALDNNVNLRGVGILVDRGTGSIVLNTEYRQTLYEKKVFVLQGNAFLDAGTWRHPGGKLSDFTNSDNMHFYSGIGLRFMHKKIYNAIFRIDYGYGLKKGAGKGIVFGIGQYF